MVSLLFEMKQGLKQNIAPLLFNIYVSTVIDVFKRRIESRSIQGKVSYKSRFDGDVTRLIAKTKVIKNEIVELFFADDAALCASNTHDLQQLVNVFNETVVDFGLQISIGKLKLWFHLGKFQNQLQSHL